MGEMRDPYKTGWAVFVGDRNVASVGIGDDVGEPVTLKVWRIDKEERTLHSTIVEIAAAGADPRTVLVETRSMEEEESE